MKMEVLKSLFLTLRIKIVILGSLAFQIIQPFESHLYGEFSVGFIAFISLMSATMMEFNKWLTHKISYFASFVLLSTLDVAYFCILVYLFYLHPEIDRVLAAKIVVLIFPLYVLLFAVQANMNSVLTNVLLNSEEAETFSSDVNKARSRVQLVVALLLMGYSYLKLPDNGVILLFGIISGATIVYIVKISRYLKAFDKLLKKHQSEA